MTQIDSDIAICISGLTRTGVEALPNFREFFPTNADIFYHTWDEGDSDKLALIHALYQPTNYVIEKPRQEIWKIPFSCMLYSIMRSNELKRNAEMQRGRRYRTVIKTRFDVIYRPGQKFTPIFAYDRYICYSGSAPGWVSVDYGNHGISDVYFFGNSSSMDVACDTYKHQFFRCAPRARLIRAGLSEDPMGSAMSAGCMIYNRCIDHNILMIPMGTSPDLIFRNNTKHLDPITDFDMIREQGLHR